ncbi:hypothetical protein T484DRAFT_1807728 [Baffinella frigidus]|nr:hypothetical protein T484DRAFT_1807728 [Cryptophyta sp. CCMP2293]
MGEECAAQRVPERSPGASGAVSLRSRTAVASFVGALVVAVSFSAVVLWHGPGGGALALLGGGGEVVQLDTGAAIHLHRTTRGREQRLLGAMGRLQTKLSSTMHVRSGKGEDIQIASGQSLKLWPIQGTGANHVNPITGGCAYGKHQTGPHAGECRMHPLPRYTMGGRLNMPPPRGPKDSNGYRGSPPVKFPRALVSVAGEVERKSGSPEFQRKVAEEMTENNRKMQTLRNMLADNEEMVAAQEGTIGSLKAELTTSRDRLKGELAEFVTNVEDKMAKKALEEGPQGERGFRGKPGMNGFPGLPGGHGAHD